MYEGRRLVLDPARQAQSFPRTSRDNPIMLLSRDAVATVGLIFEDRMLCTNWSWVADTGREDVVAMVTRITWNEVAEMGL